MPIPRELKCPDCENLLDIQKHSKPNTFFGLCQNNQCNKAWFITKNIKDSTLEFLLAKKYEEDPRGKELQHQFGLDSLTIIYRNSEEPAHVYFDVHLNKFMIFYRSDDDLIHELGHLIIDSNQEHYKVEKPWEEENRSPIDNIFNAIVDIIVNYNLVVNYNMEKFYEDTALEGKVVDKVLKIINENKKIDVKFQLADYCYIYLELYFYLQDTEKLKASKRWKISLRKLRQRLMYVLKISVENFKEIEEQLSKIKKIKDLTNLKEICEYIFNILIEMKLWNEGIILKKLKERFL